MQHAACNILQHAACNIQHAAYDRYGIGVPKNDALAFEYYRSAAERGDKEAQNNLGYCFQQVYIMIIIIIITSATASSRSI
jgi:TPR repeat protein